MLLFLTHGLIPVFFCTPGKVIWNASVSLCCMFIAKSQPRKFHCTNLDQWNFSILKPGAEWTRCTFCWTPAYKNTWYRYFGTLLRFTWLGCWVILSKLCVLQVVLGQMVLEVPSKLLFYDSTIFVNSSQPILPNSVSRIFKNIKILHTQKG